jgi:hypothetical protein
MVARKGHRIDLSRAYPADYPPATVGAIVDLEPRAIAATPGAQATAQVRVRNSGSVVDQFSLEVLGDAQAWTEVDPPTLSLFPGAEGSATVTFSPPRSPSLRAGTLPFGLSVQSKEDPAGSVVDEGTLEVAPFTEVSAELVPRSSRGSTGATHDIAVDNRSNVALNAALTAVDADRLLDFEIRPPAVNADPGSAAFAKVRVKPRKRFWRGGSVTRPFQLQVAVPDAEALTLDGSLLQTPILPPWTFRAVAMALLLVVAGVVAWMAFVRPAIESTAREQTEDVLAAFGLTPLPSAAPGPSGGGSPSPSSSGGIPTTNPSASPAASTTPSTLPGAGGATPVDGRLVEGGPPLAPSAGKSLYLTDFIFSNSSATATGEIRLVRSTKPLIGLRLENFRDIDYHFVTPILIAAGQELTLVCPSGCFGASVYYSGYER